MRRPCEPYRGYSIEVRVTVGQAISFSGVQRPYTVSWS